MKLGQIYKNICVAFWFKWKFLNLLSRLTDLLWQATEQSFEEIHSTYHSCCSRSCCCNLHCLLVTSKLGVEAETEAVVKFVEAETEAEKNCKIVKKNSENFLVFSDIEKRNWACEICGGWNWGWKNCKIENIFFLFQKIWTFLVFKKDNEPVKFV